MPPTQKTVNLSGIKQVDASSGMSKGKCRTFRRTISQLIPECVNQMEISVTIDKMFNTRIYYNFT